MAAIITNKFRINNAEQFVESFSESAATTYYLFIGRSHSWATDTDGQGRSINEGTDASPPTPNDDISSEFYNYDDMLGAKLLTSSDVSHVIPRRNWTTGTTYDMYEHNISSSNAANSGATNLFDSTFFVMNSSNAVYKVIENDGATASTVEPTSTSNSIFETSDGYRWKYMYSLTSAETLNFMSTDFIHVSTDSTVSAAAVDGALDTILVVAGGSSFTTSSGSTISAIPIRGDGTGGIASVTISSGAVATATVTTAGSGYTFAYIRDADIITATNAGGAGSGANLNVIIPPKGGHGSNAVKELGGFFVMLNKSLVGVEGTSDINSAFSMSTGLYDANGPLDVGGLSSSFTFNGAGQLNIGNDLTSFRNFTANNSLVVFDGISVQNIPQAITFYNLKVDGAGVNASNNIVIDGTLVLGNGDISTSGFWGKLTLKSSFICLEALLKKLL